MTTRGNSSEKPVAASNSVSGSSQSESRNTDRSGPLFNRSAWRYFYEFYRDKIPQLLLYAIVASLQSLMVVPVVYLIRAIFDEAIPEGDVSMLFSLGAIILAIRVSMSVIKLGMRLYVLKIVKHAVARIRESLVSDLYRISRDFFTGVPQDTIHTRVVQDTERVDIMSNKLLSVMLPAAITAVALTVVLLALNWQLVIAGCLIFPLLWWATKRTGRLVKRSVYQFQRSFERFSSGIRFVLHHMDLTRERGHEAREHARQESQVRDLRDKGVRMAMSYALNGEVQSNITGLAGLMILILGGAAIASGGMTLGEFVSFYVAAGLLNSAINQLLVGLPDVITGNESLVTLTRLFDGYDDEPYRGTQAIREFSTLELEHIGFGYGDREILRDVSLSIDAGANIAIVGENGAGKTSLIRLILGFHRPDRGSIRANGIDYRDISIRDFRMLTGLVPQTPTFFPGTVLDNISYGVPDYSAEDLQRATRLALVDEIAASLPMGLETEIGDDGVRLSGGARQRIAIARALLGCPSILILDEPTNHLDLDSIQRLMHGLTAWKDRPATILISHDARVVQYASVRYRLQEGQLVFDQKPVRAAGA